MSRFLLLSAGVAAILAAGAGPALAESAQPAVPALTGSSSAAIVHLVFVLNGQKSDSGPELPVSGSAPPAYNKQTIKSTYKKSTQILGGVTFDRSATKVETNAAGHATAATGILATAEAEVGSFNGVLNSPLGKVITVTTGKIQSEARFTQTKAGVRSVQGNTSLVNVKIDSDALGIHKTYSGKPKPNQVLYHNSDNSLIIYLNRQVTTTVAGKVAALTVDAIDVQLNKLQFSGQTISGSITVGPTLAK